MHSLAIGNRCTSSKTRHDLSGTSLTMNNNSNLSIRFEIPEDS